MVALGRVEEDAELLIAGPVFNGGKQKALCCGHSGGSLVCLGGMHVATGGLEFNHNAVITVATFHTLPKDLVVANIDFPQSSIGVITSMPSFVTMGIKMAGGLPQTGRVEWGFSTANGTLKAGSLDESPTANIPPPN